MCPPHNYCSHTHTHTYIQSLSKFVIEVNLFLAKSSDESVNLTDAQRFLKASRFNASKAIDVFKNYHVSNNQSIFFLLHYVAAWAVHSVLTRDRGVSMCLDNFMFATHWPSFLISNLSLINTSVQAYQEIAAVAIFSLTYDSSVA